MTATSAYLNLPVRDEADVRRARGVEVLDFEYPDGSTRKIAVVLPADEAKGKTQGAGK